MVGKRFLFDYFCFFLIRKKCVTVVLSCHLVSRLSVFDACDDSFRWHIVEALQGQDSRWIAASFISSTTTASRLNKKKRTPKAHSRMGVRLTINVESWQSSVPKEAHRSYKRKKVYIYTYRIPLYPDFAKIIIHRSYFIQKHVRKCRHERICLVRA